jgi:hypothetical protein
MKFNASNTTLDVKKRVEDSLKIPVEVQKLLAMGKWLKDDLTLKDQGTISL